MKIAVCIKWVADLDSVDVDPIDGEVDESRVLSVLDPGAESALAVALRLARDSDDAGKAGHVTAYSVGPRAIDPALRAALAAGVERALRIDAEPRPSTTAAELARAIVADGPFDLVLLGSRSSDHGSGEVPALLAHELGLPVVTDIGALQKVGTAWEAEREMDRGTKEIVRVEGAAVLALGPDVARLGRASLPAFMRAEQATVEVRPAAAMELPTGPVILERTLLPPRPRTLSLRAKPPEGSADQRLAAITQGAAGTRTRGRMIEGTPAEAADAIMTFLRERHLLDPAR